MSAYELSAEERLNHTRRDPRAFVSELRDLRTRGAISDAVYTLILEKLRETVRLMEEVPDIPLPSSALPLP
jgi:hypothetical protein